MSKCPICETPTVQKYRPFCSKRCADIDLGKWMTGGYALPSEEPEPEEPATAVAGGEEESGTEPAAE